MLFAFCSSYLVHTHSFFFLHLLAFRRTFRPRFVSKDVRETKANERIIVHGMNDYGKYERGYVEEISMHTHESGSLQFVSW